MLAARVESATDSESQLAGSSGELVLVLNAPEAAQAFMRRWWRAVPEFVCVLAHTDTCLIPGISAAGATVAVRPYTPAADAEAVIYGVPRCLPSIPTNPLGPPGPVGITHAAVRLARMPVSFVAAGLRVWPEVPYERVDCAPGGRIDLGGGVPEATRLFRDGIDLGQKFGRRTTHLVLGESVPGGTTTALALLLALGFDARGRVSGSLRDNARVLKDATAQAALRSAGLGMGEGRADPLGAAAEVGDPMQPVAAGIAVGALANGAEVLLAGGSQMLAIVALMLALETVDGGALSRLAVGTTRWVAQDPAADVTGLAREVCPTLPLLAANLDFSTSRHEPLQQYEDFLVKEGVGAGGVAIAAHLATGASSAALHTAIDDAYDRVCGRHTKSPER